MLAADHLGYPQLALEEIIGAYAALGQRRLFFFLLFGFLFRLGLLFGQLGRVGLGLGGQGFQLLLDIQTREQRFALANLQARGELAEGIQ